jgi:stage III sporulation protein AH
MKKEKIKQSLLLISAVFLIGVGYLNYSSLPNEYEKTVEVASRGDGNDITLGDVELVSTNAIVENKDISENTNAISSSMNFENYENKSSEEDIEKDEYFEKTRIERENMYSQMIDTYQKMVSNNDVSAEQKMIASQEITNITKTKNGIMIAENLIKNKGFTEVVILVNNNNASVIVKTQKLENEEIAKIQNIVSRELAIEVGNINISNK